MEKYSKYKDSDIEWLGIIPVHWEVIRVKDYTYLKARIGWQGLRSDEFIDNSNWYCVTGTNFNDNGTINWESCYYIDEYRYEQDKKIQLRIGDLLITKDGTIGKTAIVYDLPKKATLNSGVFVLRPLQEKYNIKYFYWLLNSSVFLDFNDIHRTGSTILHLYQNIFERFTFCIPPLSEQQAIATYLDKKTQTIDKKVSLLEQKISYYRELRKSLINTTVTKGLNPNAPLKDSGIDWIGQIPEHWEVKRVKDVLSTQTGNSISDKGQFEKYGDSDFYISTKDIDLDTGKIVYDNGIYIPKSDNSFKRAKSNSTLICLEGANAGKKIGFTYQKVCFVNKLCAIKGKINNIVDKYFFYFFNSRLFNDQFSPLLSGLIGGVSINQIKFINVIVPTFQEQTTIANYLDEKTSKIDAIISNIEQQIEKAKELRKTLINDVVTGKIKVV